MNECNHHWFQVGHTCQWQCENCEAEFPIEDNQLQRFVTNQFQIHKLFEGVKPYDPVDRSTIYVGAVPPIADERPWYDMTTGKLMKWNGKEWVEMNG